MYICPHKDLSEQLYSVIGNKMSNRWLWYICTNKCYVTVKNKFLICNNVANLEKYRVEQMASERKTSYCIFILYETLMHSDRNHISGFWHFGIGRDGLGKAQEIFWGNRNVLNLHSGGSYKGMLSASCMCRFCIHRFNQLQIENILKKQ